MSDDAITIKNTQLDQQQDTIALLHSQSSSENMFSSMCNSLLETVAAHKVIQERCLFDFNRLAVQIISNAIEILSEPLNTLVKTFLNYLHYSVRNDSDQNRVWSYIRAYQITSMLDVYRTEQKHEELLRKEVKVNKQNQDLLYNIFQFPGISFSELQAKLDFSDSELNKRTRQLEEKKLLNSHKTEYEDEPYYTLSRLGRDLCQDLFAPRTHRVIPNQWSHERVCILYLLLETQPVSSGDSIPVMTLVRKVSELREEDVQYFALKMKKHMKKHAFDKDSDEESLISHKDFIVPLKIRTTVQSIPSKIDFQQYDYDIVNKGVNYNEYHSAKYPVKD